MPQVTILGNGLTVLAYHLPGQYVVSGNLVLELPINAEPNDRDGLATITVRSLDEGTIDHPGLDLSAALEEIGAEFDGLVGLSTTQCLLDVPSDRCEAAMALLSEVVTTAAFSPEDVARIVANRLSEIEQQEARGSFVASTALHHGLVAPELRLSRRVGGDTASVSQISRDDVAEFHRRHYRPESATMILAGDLSDVDVEGSILATLGQWTNPDARETAPQPVTAGTPQRQLIHRPGAVQADVRIGWFGIDRSDERWAATQIALAIMGGTFTSRLNHELREERGLTYGVSMAARPFRQGGTIDVSCSTQTASTGEVIEQSLAILAAEQPFTADEVDHAIAFLTRSTPLAFDTAEAVVSQAASLAAARLNLDYVTATLTALTQVTPASAMEAYRSLINPDTASVVVVGDGDQMPTLDLG
jgi:predicted Zn-dependent peptidase